MPGVRYKVAAAVLPAALLFFAGPGAPVESQSPTVQTERFDRDPGWDGHNNRSPVPEPRRVRQDFGWSGSRRAGSTGGEIGGFISPSAEPAYYGKTLPDRTLNDPLSASGTLVVAGRGEGETGAGNTLVGFFNAGTLKEWRTPNTLVLRVNGRGDGFHAHLEYATSRWRAGGDFFGQGNPGTGKKEARLHSTGAVHSWSLRYDPEGNGGDGTLTAVVDGERLVVNLEAGHKADGATFNRFGILNVMKSADGGGSLWVGDLTLNGSRQALGRNPRWDGRGNRRIYTSTNVRPRFDFGYSRSRHAGGKAAGEMGGLVFRGDERYPERMAYYAARLPEYTLDNPLRATGKVCLRRGVTDSTSLLGFFHSEGSMRSSAAQLSGLPENFLGAAIEGPSREGFFFYPAYGTDREGVSLDVFRAAPRGPEPPRIYPDGKSHSWTLDYSPAAGERGRIILTLDGRESRLELTPEHRALGARFNRFGIVTTHIDGNGQTVYYDDLTYTGQAARTSGGPVLAPPAAPMPR